MAHPALPLCSFKYGTTLNFWLNAFPKVCVKKTPLFVDQQERFYFRLWVLEVQKGTLVCSLIPPNFCPYRAIISMKKNTILQFLDETSQNRPTYCAWQVLTFDAFRLKLFASFYGDWNTMHSQFDFNLTWACCRFWSFQTKF